MYTHGKQITKVDIGVTVPQIFSGEGMSCGWDHGDNERHDASTPPFQFNETIKVISHDLSGEAIQDAEAEMPRALA